MKAIGLLSGGLDSTIAARLMLEQEIEVVDFNIVTPLCTCTRKGCKHEATWVATQFNICEQGDLNTAAVLCARYSDAPSAPAEIEIDRKGKERGTIKAPFAYQELEPL